MSGYRLQRINRQLQVEISIDLRDEIKDPRIHSVSITSVDVSADLALAKVYFSYYDPKAEDQAEGRAQCMEGLKKAAPYLRELLKKKLSLKHIPRLIFKHDDSIERGVRVLRMINELDRPDTDGPEPEADDGP